MASTVRQGFEILREEGVASLLSSGARHVRRESTRTYSKLRYDPDAPECRVAAADWDNLVVLDACRFDQFERLNAFSESVDARTSLGSCTPEFLENNFAGAALHDTVYVTANPMYRRKDFDGTFHAIVDVWESEWDDRLDTVRPADMVRATLDACETYPDKRIIAHFIQPHFPFIGEAAAELRAQAETDLYGADLIREQVAGGRAHPRRPTPWELLEAGEVDPDLVRAAYDETLDVALSHVEDLVDAFDGRTVVTSDHGNALGTRVAPFGPPVYGHPPYTYADELRKVPWLVVESETRKRVRSEPPRERGGAAAAGSDVGAAASERLADLGYAEQ